MTPPTDDDAIAAVRSALHLREHWLSMNEPGSTIWLENKARADALRLALSRLEASRWRPIDEHAKNDVCILWREKGIDPFIGYWDDQFSGWFSLAGAYVMESAPTHYLPLSVLPNPPSTSERE